MKADELYTLLNDLPDDYVTQAAGTHRQSHRIFRVVIPALAACITLLFTAAVYPKLRAQIPERREDSVSTETTAAVTTESAAEAQTPGVTTASQTEKATGTATTVPQSTHTTAAGTAGSQPEQSEAEQTASVTGKTSAEQVTRITEKVQATDTVRTTVTTKNTGSPVEAEESEPQTVPYLVSKTRTTVPRNSYQETPETVPVEEIIPGTDLPTTEPWSPPGGSPSTGSFFETVPGTELPTEQTTAVCVIIVPITTTTQPQESAEKPEPPETEWDGNILRITPKKAYQDAALLYVSIDRDGILHLTLLCLNGDVPEEDTVQISLELPAGITRQITETEAQIRETKNPALFEKASGRTPVLYSQTEKGG